ncbi:hypothetical protein D3C76_203600 [compost metagenome]
MISDTKTLPSLATIESNISTFFISTKSEALQSNIRFVMVIPPIILNKIGNSRKGYPSQLLPMEW